ncbi:phage tail protein I [uncultured Dialister sp.]|uniref:phage tail protein I n=1 Tax=uncultured Dialister sp. TaxID=278064 RepID=UPI0025D64287|nr:phage tail protein I [uncultured Dialister sp.]
MSRIKDFDLKTILPASISSDPNVQNAADAVSLSLATIINLIPAELVYSRIDKLPDDILDILAWQFHVDDYDDTVDIDVKRRQIKTAVAIHRYKGTAFAVRQVVDNLAGGAGVKEWYEYGGEHYHFRVENMPDEVKSGKAVDTLVRAIDNAKNVRSWLDELRWSRDGGVAKYYGIATDTHKDIIIGLPKVEPINAAQKKYFAAATYIFKDIRIGGTNG